MGSIQGIRHAGSDSKPVDWMCLFIQVAQFLPLNRRKCEGFEAFKNSERTRWNSIFFVLIGHS
jgi:hypothetical protein